MGMTLLSISAFIPHGAFIPLPIVRVKYVFLYTERAWRADASGPGDLNAILDAPFQSAPYKDLSLLRSLLLENHSSKETRRRHHFPPSLSRARVWPRLSPGTVLPVLLRPSCNQPTLRLTCSALSRKSLAHRLLQPY